MRCRLRFFLWRLPPAWLSLMHHLRCVSMSCVPSPSKKRFSWQRSIAPKLKAAASQVDQAKSALRAAIAAWYPTVDLSASGLPEYFKSYSYRNPDFVTNQRDLRSSVESQWRLMVLQVSWDLINPARVPQIAAARDRFERAGDAYLIALRDLRLEVQTAYFRFAASR